MVLRSLTPMKPKFLIGLLAYFFASCIIAAQINGMGERVANPLAATVLAVMSAVVAVFALAPVFSRPARDLMLRADVSFGRGDKAAFLISGAIATAFAAAFIVIAIRGVS